MTLQNEFDENGELKVFLGEGAFYLPDVLKLDIPPQIAYIKGMKDSCPKCSGIMLSGSLKEHIKNCKSTLVEDVAKAFSDRIDDMVYRSLIG